MWLLFCKSRSSSICTDLHASNGSMALYSPVTLTFELKVNACQGPALQYIWIKFGGDSSIRFSFIVPTHTRTATRGYRGH